MFSSSLLVTMITGVVGRLLDQRKRLEARHAGHHLVEDYQVVGCGAHHVDGVVTVVAGIHLVTLTLEKKDMRTQKLYLVIHPKYLNHNVQSFLHTCRLGAAFPFI